MNSNELIYSPFTNTTNKSDIILTPILGSMVALHDDNHNGKNAVINQRSTLPKVTNEDVNTVSTTKLPFISNLYVASLTVVGLFILFRFVQKHP
jgi:hypothetical protein